MIAKLARARALFSLASLVLVSCFSGDATSPPGSSCAHTNASTGTLSVLGCGRVDARFTAEVAVRGTTAYTTTWGERAALGNWIGVWDVASDAPVLVDSVLVAGATTLGDVAISDDGALLVVAAERANGKISIFSLADPRRPALVSELQTPETYNGVHTAEIGRVNGRLYAVLAVDPFTGAPAPAARTVIVDLGDPAHPQQVSVTPVATSAPFVHDTYLRDGILFVALWNQGLQIWDVGGGGHGGTMAAPVVLGSLATVNGHVHNVWWYHDASGGRRYAFVGEENAPAELGLSSTGDIHVVDVADLTAPREVAFFHAEGAGTHNFSMDESRGILYAAYYNAGVQALDVRGDLGTCTAAEQVVTGSLTRCDLRAMGRALASGLTGGSPPVYVWGVQLSGGVVYASDMLNGLWKLRAVP